MYDIFGTFLLGLLIFVGVILFIFLQFIVFYVHDYIYDKYDEYKLNRLTKQVIKLRNECHKYLIQKRDSLNDSDL